MYSSTTRLEGAWCSPETPRDARDPERFVAIAEAQMSPELQAQNASALGKALFFSCVIPTLLSAWGLKDPSSPPVLLNMLNLPRRSFTPLPNRRCKLTRIKQIDFMRQLRRHHAFLDMHPRCSQLHEAFLDLSSRQRTAEGVVECCLISAVSTKPLACRSGWMSNMFLSAEGSRSFH